MIKVRIPATSANLGSGFDSLGLAVTLYNYVFMEEAEGCRITAIDGADIPTDETNLVYTTAKYLYDLCGRPFSGLRILQENNIPLARGLGSSSACIIGGLFGANALLGDPVGRDEIINIAATIEGHPDNVTPAILGGLVTTALDNGKVFYVKQEIATDLRFVTFVPDFELQTSIARAALPKEIFHKDAVFNLSRAALMSVSLYSGKYENLRVGADDRLQQPYRLSLIPGGEQAVSMAYDLGAYAAYISGAGSTIMAIIDAKDENFVPRARKALDGLGLQAWGCTEYSIDNTGAQIF
jgi:homoserine kinase